MGKREADPIFEYINNGNARRDIDNLTWVGWMNKYRDCILAFKDKFWNIEIIPDIIPTFYDKDKELVLFYEYLVNRIALCLNLAKGKTNEELKQLLKQKEEG